MIDPDDLALLAKGFEGAMERGGEIDATLHDLGWGDLLDAAPLQGAAAVFTLLGTTGSVATLLDDVLVSALGLPAASDSCVVLPAPHATSPAGVASDGRVRVDGLVSTRIDTAARAIVPVTADGEVVVVDVDPAALGARRTEALDSQGPYRRVLIELDATTEAEAVSWDRAVRAAQIALAHQLIGASRRMLELARTHALDRVQFGRPIASFQAVRHKLAESLVAIETAAAVADAAVEWPDDLTAALAKSLAGKAARTTATHAQQVLAGIGFTTEHPFHLYLKRALVVDTLFGSAGTLPAEIGRALLARRTAPRLIEL